jgi:glutathione synthase/RimK-type ligase-like ATP-grasp enzyme
VESAIERGHEVRVIDYLKCHMNIAGIDLLRSNHGPVIMDVNSSPGLEGIESTTGKDVAGYNRAVHREARQIRKDADARQGIVS